MFEKLNRQNLSAVVEMALKLYPDSEKKELTTEFNSKITNENWFVCLYKNALNRYTGFMEMALRFDYVEGCSTSPVAYLEGIFVKDEFRKSGIATELLRAGEKWAREKGCSEMASDCENNNLVSAQFHKAVGFNEANRIICFTKKIT